MAHDPLLNELNIVIQKIGPVYLNSSFIYIIYNSSPMLYYIICKFVKSKAMV